MYNAVIVSKLTYGLDSLQLTDGLVARIDAFQMRGIRHILRIEHAYWSRKSNEEIQAKTNMILMNVEDAINLLFCSFFEFALTLIDFLLRSIE